MSDKSKSILESLTDSDKYELMLELEELAISSGYRNFSKLGDETNITPENQKLIESKADDNDVIKHDGSVGLTANWITPFKITANQIASNIAVGTAPLEVVSTTVVSNLNADTVDGVHAGTLAADSTVLKKDGSVALTADWDAGNGRMIQTDKIRARDADGLALYEDAGLGIFIKDGGNVGIGTVTPAYKLSLAGDAGMIWATVHFVTQGHGYGDPSAAETISDGDKIIFFNGASAKAGFGAGEVNDVWIQCSSSSATNAAFRIFNGVAGASPSELLRLLGNGTLGLGFTTPVAKLSINGGLHVGGTTDPGDNNLLVDGTAQITGTTQITGKVGIGVVATSKLQVSSLYTSQYWTTGYWTQSGLDGYNGGIVNDGDLVSHGFYTDSGGVGCYLKLTTASGDEREFTKLRYVTSGGSQNAIWDIEYSDNNSTWVKAYVGFNVSAGTDLTVEFTNVGKHRYWRLYKTNSAVAGGYANEVQFYERSSLFKLSNDTVNPLSIDHLGNIGFYNASPVAQHAAIANATDAASAISQLNLALAALRSLGLIAT